MQKTLCSNSLATLLLSDQHQPESVPSVWCTVFTDILLKTMQIKTNFEWKIEGRKEAVSRLKTVCTWNVPGLWTLNIFAYDIYLCWGTLTKHDCEPLFGHGNTFDRGLPVYGPTPIFYLVKAAEILYLWVVVVAAENHNKMSEMASLKVVIAPCW